MELIEQNEVIKPTVNGMLDVMRSCKKGGVKRVIFTASAGTVNVMEHQLPEYDETCWSDLDFINRVKMTGWMYFVSKIFAERAAMDFAEQNGLDFISVVPTLVVGQFITHSMPPSLITALAVVTGNESHYSILKQVQLVHLDDLCLSLIFLYEHPETKGRYISSSHDTTIVAIAKMLNQRYPEYSIPTKFEGIDDDIAPVRFSSKKLTDMGFKFQYTMVDMYDGAIKSCIEKNLITPRKLADHNQDSSVAQITHIPNGADPSVAAI